MRLDHPVADGGQRDLGALLFGAQGFLRAAALGHVHQRADGAGLRAAGGGEGRLVVRHVARGEAVGRLDADLVVPRLCEPGRALRRQLGRVVGGRGRGARGVRPGLEEPLPRAVDLQVGALRVAHEHRQRQGVDELAREVQLLALQALGFAQRQHQRLHLARHVVEGGGQGARLQRSGHLHAGVHAALAECVGGLRQAPQHACVGAQQQREQEQDGEDVERGDAHLHHHRVPHLADQRLRVQNHGEPPELPVGRGLAELLHGRRQVHPFGEPGGRGGGRGRALHLDGGPGAPLPPQGLQLGREMGGAFAQGGGGGLGVVHGQGSQGGQQRIADAAQFAGGVAVDFGRLGGQQVVIAHGADQQDDQHDGQVQAGVGAPPEPGAEMSGAHGEWCPSFSFKTEG